MRFKETKTIITAVFLVCFGSMSARAQQVYEISVKEAVDLAFKNVNDLKNARLDYKISEARNKEITGMALPQVTGSFQGNHYLSLPQIQFPDGTEKAIYDVLRDKGVKDGSGNPITTVADLSYRNFSFFTPWNINPNCFCAIKTA